MAKLKKYPKPPKRGKKPKATASIDTHKRYLDRCRDQDKAYAAKCTAVDKHNAPIVSAEKEKKKIISQIGSVGRCAPKKKK